MGNTYTESQKKAIYNYQKKQKSLSIRIKPDMYDRFKEAADQAGMSLREFVIEAIEEKIEK